MKTLKCPACDGHLVVVDTRKRSDGTTRRTRRCVHCGRNFICSVTACVTENMATTIEKIECEVV